MKFSIKGNVVFIIFSLLTVGIATAQHVQIGDLQNQNLIPGQIAVYLEDGVTPGQAESRFSDLNLIIVETDIMPVRATLHNPGKAVIEQIENHPAIGQFEIMAFVYDSTTLKNLKFAEGMSEEQKEEGRKRFLNREDRTILFLSFKDKFSSREAEAVLSDIEGIGHFNLRTSPRIAYIEVNEGTESEQMEKIRSLPFVTDVTRVAASIVENQ